MTETTGSTEELPDDSVDEGDQEEQYAEPLFESFQDIVPPPGEGEYRDDVDQDPAHPPSSVGEASLVGRSGIRTGNAACLWGRGQHEDGGTEWDGLCQMFVRMCFNVGSLQPSAAAAWHGADHKHHTKDGNNVPRAVPYFWLGGSQGFGHVVLSVGGGWCWTNDFKRQGGIDLARINDITSRWGQSPQGWTEDINEVRIWTPGSNVSQWSKGDVYVEKLRRGQTNSDSVRRLQYRLRHHARAGTKDLPINGNYGSQTTSAVLKWKNRIAAGKNHTGGSLNDDQANRLFGDNYRVIEEGKRRP